MRYYLITALTLISFLSQTALGATFPEPENLIYGSITLDDSPISAADTGIVVEARRTIDGPAISRYQMGSQPSAGNFYLLSLSLEAGDGPISEDTATPSETLFIVVSDASGDRAQAPYTVGERGEVMRLDFGSPVGDADGNGLPDLWEIEHFGTSGLNPEAISPNGHTVRTNFEAGTDPNDTADLFQIFAELVGGQRKVSFFARQASGPGYGGLARFYTLQSTTNLNSGPWSGVPGYIDLTGTNLNVIHTTPAAGPPIFYRGTVRLQEE